MISKVQVLKRKVERGPKDMEEGVDDDTRRSNDDARRSNDPTTPPARTSLSRKIPAHYRFCLTWRPLRDRILPISSRREGKLKPQVAQENPIHRHPLPVAAAPLFIEKDPC